MQQFWGQFSSTLLEPSADLPAKFRQSCQRHFPFSSGRRNYRI